MMATERFWNAAQSIIDKTEKHEFLTSMVDGTLPLENFQYYVVQDALYLTDFAECLRRLGDNATKINDKNRLYSLAKGAEEDEKELHRSFFTKWDINDSNVSPMPQTLSYTSYMIRVVSTKPHAEGLAVLLPCFWVYMHVGKCMLKLRDELGDTAKRSPQFDAWIDLYASEEFEKEVKDYIAMVDAAAEGLDEESISKMEEHFILCCKLEHLFWDQALELTKWPNF
mmetsp:Transcript_29202/g.33901  ORF Transcript_29202/g.33901 Transcript_29202/m.33901 type:complete len:226 (-) Transcript_29202:370-1047(-)